MVDPNIVGAVTTAVSIGTGIASAPVNLEVAKRLLGPWLDDRGQRILEISRQKRAEKVMRRAVEKVDLAAPGGVPPRVAAAVMDQAEWADEDVVVEYLAGVLASSRTPDAKDDAGVSWVALIGRLSSLEIRMHYVLYAALRQKVEGAKVDGYFEWTRRGVLVDVLPFLNALGIDKTHIANARFLHPAHTLQREGLLTDLTYGSRHYLETDVVWTKGRVLPEGAFFVHFKPSVDGIALFLAGLGVGDQWYTYLSEPELSSKLMDDESGELAIPIHFIDELARKN